MTEYQLTQDVQVAATSLIAGGVGVLPTDTIYGLVARALDSKAVERVYEVRRRRPDKPCIILIADAADLTLFGIKTDEAINGILKLVWPGPVSVVLPCEKSEFSYLHRGTKTLAFRLPANEQLQAILRKTGPLIAPSANPEGQKPAATIAEAKVYFEDTVDFYVPAKDLATAGVDEPLVGAPSTVVAIENGKVVILRQGGTVLPPELGKTL